MKNKIIVGNIKTDMLYGEIENYINYFSNVKYDDLIICPSYIYIPYFLNYKFKVGSQNVSIGDFNCTGEISSKQLNSMGVDYTIIGHSDRRLKCNESDLDINKKVKNALDNNLKVILCVGETLEEFNMLKKDVVIKKQIRSDLNGITDLFNVIIAYEPIWSIGTNKIPSKDEIVKTVKYIKQLVYDMYKQNIKVIYGGSVNEKNIDSLNLLGDIDGFLIGSRSLEPSKFIEIIDRIIF